MVQSVSSLAFSSEASLAEALTLAQDHRRAGRESEAALVCRHILDASPEHPQALHLLGLLALDAGDSAKATEALGRSLASNFSDPDVWYDFATALRGCGQGSLAADAYGRALELRPEMVEAWFNMGLLLDQAGQSIDAVDCFRKSLDVKDAPPIDCVAEKVIQSEEIWLRLGAAMIRAGRPFEAVGAYRRANKINPERIEGHFHLAVTLQSIGQIDAAVVFYRQALALDPTSIDIWSRLGSALAAIDRLTESITCYHKALDLLPDAMELPERAELKESLASIYMVLANRCAPDRERDQAIGYYQAVVALSPERSEAHFQLARLWSAVGRIDQAAPALRRSLEALSDEALIETHLTRSPVARGKHPLLASILSVCPQVHVVDVGANPIERSPPYLSLLRAGQARVIGFQPNPMIMARLERRKGIFEVYYPYAIGDGRRHHLRLCRQEDMSSLLEPNIRLLSWFHDLGRWGAVTQEVEVETLRLDDVAEIETIDFLRIDQQGAALMILKNAERRLNECLVTQVKVEFLPLYSEQPLFSDVEAFLRERGFLLHHLEAPQTGAVAPLAVPRGVQAGNGGQILSADAVFLRDFTQWGACSDERLLRMAAILHDCYGAFDLTLRSLMLYDQARGLGYAEKYKLQAERWLGGSDSQK
ncbi:hypothetical protein CCP2SC5_680013 [Azospirillaceae bacterium]